jgi:hypothetical protein
VSEGDQLAFTPDARIATLYRMAYPTPTAEQLHRFNEDGFLVVENAIDPRELDALVRMGHEMIERPLDPKANDWDWRKGESRENRVYRIVQSAVDRHYPWLVTSAFRAWAARFGGLLMHQDLAEDNYPWRVHVNQRTGERRAER